MLFVIYCQYNKDFCFMQRIFRILYGGQRSVKNCNQNEMFFGGKVCYNVNEIRVFFM